MSYRINGFEQIKGFYSWVFNNPDKARPTHISLYLFLLNQNNRANWCEWFKCPYDLAMQGACIGNNGTYYKCLDELKEWGLIDYQKGINNFKAPLVKLFQLCDSEQLSEQVTVPLSEQQTAQQYAQQYAQLPVHIYKLLTNNLKRVTDNYNEFENFVLSLSEKEDDKPKTWRTDFETYISELRTVYQDLIEDKNWICEQEKYHPKMDILTTLEKACKQYWSTEKAWKKRKRSKSVTLDWKSTLTSSLDASFNKVYK